ncbi:hypothetical protein EHS86_13560 [Erwinia amylovora]|uniref:Uncharacterized protein n=1 Tax=Erwinia amylovora NBRC 12687 = CFBP 1232 TaxID=1219359 RepID=A0A831EJF8_ERWAM|nr:hypothetical protein [Erwinia amylovora]EKV53972.1 hypothetical protein EaACW_1272 [Erwinia amylovora ACW56400]CBJ45937.1 hypothetical protein EAM_1262 [Erwinia amylovora ATCC 49946]CCO78118.1 hypothetical protein BN432_1308 [Erwinia amylovora Ea356]CCO81905.1 hypothetical protein BN433_1321 [Erwinia amylovora Ea266]CCO85704.1 hypothetical protein BN434_1304 [Erwinia amylovora CFBP 2585]CCO89490.1 hypothetical protein BN435_1306 [Erwinia amylovora 01SFR-BO]CCO93243.1 hypothetical protein 
MPVKKDKNSVFRVEALQHKREGWLGPSRLHIPSSLTVGLFRFCSPCMAHRPEMIAVADRVYNLKEKILLHNADAVVQEIIYAKTIT